MLLYGGTLHQCCCCRYYCCSAACVYPTEHLFRLAYVIFTVFSVRRTKHPLFMPRSLAQYTQKQQGIKKNYIVMPIIGSYIHA